MKYTASYMKTFHTNITLLPVKTELLHFSHPKKHFFLVLPICSFVFDNHMKNTMGFVLNIFSIRLSFYLRLSLTLYCSSVERIFVNSVIL